MNRPKPPKVGQTGPTRPYPAEIRPEALAASPQSAGSRTWAHMPCNGARMSEAASAPKISKRTRSIPLKALLAGSDLSERTRSLLTLVYYEQFRDTLPNGLPRPQRIVEEAKLMRSGAFLTTARVVYGKCNELALEVNLYPYDCEIKEYTFLAIDMPMMRTIYELMVQERANAQARKYTWTAGS